MPVKINDLILLNGPGVNSGSQGTVFSFNADPAQSQLADVYDQITFNQPDGTFGNFIPIGSTVTLNDITYTLTEVYDFWGQYTKIDPETGDSFTQQGQSVALTLTAPDGETFSFIVPSDTFNPSDPWQPGNITAIEVISEPYTETGIQEGVGGTNKLSGDDNVTIPCFTIGTLIDTAQGARKIEDIRPGDLVLTRDEGFLPVKWIGQRAITGLELAQNPDFAAVIIRAGALGHGLPVRDLRVSPWHRVLVCGQRAELMFGEHEVLVAAAHLVGQPGISRDNAPVTYVHVMFDTHQIIRSEGAWSESFQPGVKTLSSMDDAQRAELLALFPELADQNGQEAYVAARLTLSGPEVKALLAA
ncbi:MAG: Hint domain-containing protein [Roseinatronobacter sp.]